MGKNNTEDTPTPEEAVEKVPGTITAKTGNLECTVNKVIPDTLAGLVDEYGEEAVAAAAGRSAKIDLQAALRRALENGSDPQKVADEWKLGVSTRVPAGDRKAQAIAMFKNMSDEEKAAFIASLQE